MGFLWAPGSLLGLCSCPFLSFHFFLHFSICKAPRGRSSYAHLHRSVSTLNHKIISIEDDPFPRSSSPTLNSALLFPPLNHVLEVSQPHILGKKGQFIAYNHFCHALCAAVIPLAQCLQSCWERHSANTELNRLGGFGVASDPLSAHCSLFRCSEEAVPRKGRKLQDFGDSLGFW